MMASFDAPTREFCSVRRLPSNTPLQALMTLNDAAFVEASESLAQRMRSESEDENEQVRFGFLLATCREPSDVELETLVKLANQKRTQDPLQAVATVLLNLDEVLTK